MGNKCGGRCFMKKSGIGCYGDSENLACVWEYLHP